VEIWAAGNNYWECVCGNGGDSGVFVGIFGLLDVNGFEKNMSSPAPIRRLVGERLRMEGGQCPACNAVMIPRRFGSGGACLECGSGEVEDINGNPVFVILGEKWFEKKVGIPVEMVRARSSVDA
jgi:hypothetical protein